VRVNDRADAQFTPPARHDETVLSVMYGVSVRISFKVEMCLQCLCLQSFDAVGWAAGRASGL